MAIKISIAGLGWWGKVMIERLSRSNKLEIVNLIDPFPDQEALKLAKTNNFEIYKDFDTALNSKTFDAIILCTPNSFHMEQTLKASKLGIHVFCEKPLSLKSFEVKEMINVCNQNELILGVGHERRFEKGWMRLKEIINGKVLFFKIISFHRPLSFETLLFVPVIASIAVLPNINKISGFMIDMCSFKNVEYRLTSWEVGFLSSGGLKLTEYVR